MPSTRCDRAPLRASGITLAVVFGFSSAVIGVTWLIHALRGTLFGNLTRDPAAIFNYPIYVGFLSQVGILLWAATVAICLFAGAVLWRHETGARVARFLVCSGAVTLMLGFDDAFLIHERVAPRLGISEMWLYSGYAGAVVLLLVVFSPVVMKTEFLVLGTALGFFAASIAMDFFHPAIPLLFLVEDGLKFVGIVGWLAYFVRTALQATRTAAS